MKKMTGVINTLQQRGMPAAAQRLIDVTAMAVMIRNVAGHNWGWMSREDPRMHVQTVDQGALLGRHKTKAWLENKGVRTFEPLDDSLGAREWKKLQTAVKNDRPHLESRWIAFMVQNDWLAVELLNTTTIRLTAYPDSHNRFIRTVDLKNKLPVRMVETWGAAPPRLDLISSPGLLAIGTEQNPDERHHLDLSEFLFID